MIKRLVKTFNRQEDSAKRIAEHKNFLRAHLRMLDTMKRLGLPTYGSPKPLRVMGKV